MNFGQKFNKVLILNWTEKTWKLGILKISPYFKPMALSANRSSVALSSGKIDQTPKFIKLSRLCFNFPQGNNWRSLSWHCSIEGLSSDRLNLTQSGEQSLCLTSTSTLGGGQRQEKLNNSNGEGTANTICDIRDGWEKDALYLRWETSLNFKEFLLWALPGRRQVVLRQFVAFITISNNGAKITKRAPISENVKTSWNICIRSTREQGRFSSSVESSLTESIQTPVKAMSDMLNIFEWLLSLPWCWLLPKKTSERYKCVPCCPNSWSALRIQFLPRYICLSSR